MAMANRMAAKSLQFAVGNVFPSHKHPISRCWAQHYAPMTSLFQRQIDSMPPAAVTFYGSTLLTNSIPPSSSPSTISFTVNKKNKAILTLPRGGESDVAGMDLNRISLRLDSFEEYCLIASIILGAMIDIYQDKPDVPPDQSLERIAYSIHGICVTIGFLTAVYTTVVFSLFGLYAKTALGTGDDSGYLQLLQSTSLVRFRGFKSFIVCLLCFNTAFIMNLILNYSGTTRIAVVTIALLGTGFSIQQFTFIVHTASQVIFK